MLLSPASAQQDLSFYDTDNIIICPATMQDQSPPDFSSKECKKVNAGNLDPQNKLIWIKTNIKRTSTKGQNGEPLSLYISGKISSQIYLNNVLVGNNGSPGESAKDEIVGKMDSELYPPQNLFRIGDNEVILKASSHHGYLNLVMPIHMIGIAPTGYNGKGALLNLTPALITLGLFLLGGLYFGVMAFIGSSPIRFVSLSGICIFAAAQLISETLRGIIAYTYPIHDLRLIAIVIFSSAFGISVAFHILRDFMKTGLLPLMIGIIIFDIIIIIATTGYDYKALTAMIVPLSVTLIYTVIWSYQRRAHAFLYFIALSIFLSCIIIFQGLFLDIFFFLLVAVFLLVMFIEQAITLANESRERRHEETRANQLEQALAQAKEQDEENYINVKSAGKIERIAINQITHINGASGYAEIVLANGKTILHSATLHEMADILPALFIRVHRSHLINIMFVRSLKREASGTGILFLNEGSEIPVSRRIMPKVRQALQ